MEYFLDTHTAIWYFEGDEKLSSKALHIIKSPSTICYISPASIWEMAVKISLNKLEIKKPFHEYINDFRLAGIITPSIQEKDFILVSQLPFHHKDPFDRMIIAQAINSKMTVITEDDVFSKYGVEVLW